MTEQESQKRYADWVKSPEGKAERKLRRQLAGKKATEKLVRDEKRRGVEYGVKFVIARRLAAVLRQAKRCGYKSDLTQEHLLTLVDEADPRCSMTGVSLSTQIFHEPAPNTLSIDKIDPDKGYKIGNVRITSYIFNVAKNRFSDEDVFEMACGLVDMNRG